MHQRHLAMFATPLFAFTTANIQNNAEITK